MEYIVRGLDTVPPPPPISAPSAHQCTRHPCVHHPRDPSTHLPPSERLPRAAGAVLPRDVQGQRARRRGAIGRRLVRRALPNPSTSEPEHFRTRALPNPSTPFHRGAHSSEPLGRRRFAEHFPKFPLRRRATRPEPLLCAPPLPSPLLSSYHHPSPLHLLFSPRVTAAGPTCPRCWSAPRRSRPPGGSRSRWSSSRSFPDSPCSRSRPTCRRLLRPSAASAHPSQ